ncbi:MAG TPA: PHP domain-containing protein [Gemmatimonadaceae bacterium]|nr:PHP domain-containing protein [Gemmatimonadaceae bacterium]
MDSRTAAHVLSEISALLDLHAANRYKARAYRTAAKAVLGLDADDLAPLHRSGELAAVPGIGPATLSVIADLIENGESRYLEQLRVNVPEGVLELMRIPGLSVAKVQQIFEELGISTMDELEAAARDGRLARVKGFGQKTAEKLLGSIAFARRTSAQVLLPRAVAEAGRLLASVTRHPDVVAAGIAGSVRRRCDVVRDVDIVASVRGDPAVVAASFGRVPGVRDAELTEGHAAIRYVDGTLLDLFCVPPDEFAVALWRATGSARHVAETTAALGASGFTLAGNRVLDATLRPVPVPDEAALYALIGADVVAPELREARGEIAAATAHALPHLVTPADIRGVLHCHSSYSDGTASIAEMADAARRLGWSYLGISDHSESAFFAGGLSRDAVARQHDEIDALNATLPDFRILKGIEADILPAGDLDYDDATLDRFDFVIGSVHSRFRMTEAEMTTRILTALDDPRLTILGHPTGRLLLAREPYAVDIDAVIEKAAARGVALELNADPRRLDLDWKRCQQAKRLGAVVEIGPDAHSPRGLDNTAVGVDVARKAWLEPADVLNAWPVDDVLAFAHRPRPVHLTR